MSTPHYLVFIGASASLSEELKRIELSKGVKLIAPAASKTDRGINSNSIRDALSALKHALAHDGRHREEARLSVWAYEPIEQTRSVELWQAFGKSGWIELIPARLINQNRPTRLHVFGRLSDVGPLMHEVASAVYGGRRTSPLPLPFQNFRSGLLDELAEYWYSDLSYDAFKRFLGKIHQRFRETHTRSDRKHYDERSLAFSPAGNSECHGQSHPHGSCDRCFVGGRFRFGAALFPGFHYDVSSSNGTLSCTLYDCEGNQRDLGPERRSYINIFPNDHLLPAK